MMIVMKYDYDDAWKLLMKRKEESGADCSN